MHVFIICTVTGSVNTDHLALQQKPEIDDITGKWSMPGENVEVNTYIVLKNQPL